jgi:hypothetical protein
MNTITKHPKKEMTLHTSSFSKVVYVAIDVSCLGQVLQCVPVRNALPDKEEAW